MFNKVKNIDLLNKMLVIENKIDILNNRLDDITTVKGCCDDFQQIEIELSKEIKEYLETKMIDFNNQIKEVNQNNKISEKIINTNNVLITNFNKMFEEYKIEVVNNLQKIFDSLYNYNTKDIVVSNDNYLKKMDIINKISTFEYDITRKIVLLDSKIDSLYFDNEIIKHQLLLEEEIRKCSDEIDNLSLIIQKTISEL
jgi:hypothetical protein